MESIYFHGSGQRDHRRTRTGNRKEFEEEKLGYNFSCASMERVSGKILLICKNFKEYFHSLFSF